MDPNLRWSLLDSITWQYFPEGFPDFPVEPKRLLKNSFDLHNSFEPHLFSSPRQ
jgi:hypothetical protein